MVAWSWPPLGAGLLLMSRTLGLAVARRSVRDHPPRPQPHAQLKIALRTAKIHGGQWTANTGRHCSVTRVAPDKDACLAHNKGRQAVIRPIYGPHVAFFSFLFFCDNQGVERTPRLLQAVMRAHVRGVRDYLPEAYDALTTVSKTARSVARRYGYAEVGLPVLEYAVLYNRHEGTPSSATATTTASTEYFPQKEMYLIGGMGSEVIALRPEGTAGLVRAVASATRQQALPQRYFYTGPMFRRERPQRGRYREFQQFGIELFASRHPLYDVEVMAFGHRLLQELGLSDRVELRVNTLCDTESRQRYEQALQDFFGAVKDQLSSNSRELLLRGNPLRILDSKHPEDKQLVANAPEILAAASGESRQYFSDVCAGLDDLNISYRVDPRIVRGLEYYTGTVWEFVTSTLGSQNAVMAGGRYDNLVSEIAGSAAATVPAVGCALGIERLALMLADTQVQHPPPCSLVVQVREIQVRHCVL